MDGASSVSSHQSHIIAANPIKEEIIERAIRRAQQAIRNVLEKEDQSGRLVLGIAYEG